MRAIDATLQPDVPYRVRQLIGPWITRVARTLGQPEYRLRETEYVGTVDCRMDEFTQALQDNGFEWDPLAWYHQPPVGANPDGSWTYRHSLLADRQLHVILTAHSPGYIDVYAHEEYNWLRHPIAHLRQVGIEREEGSSEMRRWLEAKGFDVDSKAQTRRKAARVVERVRDGLATLVHGE